MAKEVTKKATEKKKKIKTPQNMALDELNQADFDEKVAEIKSEIKEGTRKIPGYSGTPGVVYVGSMPRGFHEKQMRHFFSQFGKVLKLRVSRSKKTGNPKGYAFVQFEYDEVAKVVADTMNNYLMFQKLLKCRYVPSAEVHPELFKGWNRKFTFPKAHLVSMKRHNAPKTETQMDAITKRARRKVQKKVDKLAALGIDYSICVGDKTITGQKKTIDKTQTTAPEETESELSTPARQILLEDSSDDEISMKTPPGSVRVKKSKSKVNAKAKQDRKSPATVKPVKSVKSMKTKGLTSALGKVRGKVTKGKKR